MCFFMMTFIFNVVTLIFYLLVESESKNMWSKFANATLRMINKKRKTHCDVEIILLQKKFDPCEDSFLSFSFLQ